MHGENDKRGREAIWSYRLYREYSMQVIVVVVVGGDGGGGGGGGYRDYSMKVMVAIVVAGVEGEVAVLVGVVLATREVVRVGGEGGGVCVKDGVGDDGGGGGDDGVAVIVACAGRGDGGGTSLSLATLTRTSLPPFPCFVCPNCPLLFVLGSALVGGRTAWAGKQRGTVGKPSRWRSPDGQQQ